MLAFARVLLGTMSGFFVLILVTVSLGPHIASGQLIRPNHVYQSMISGVHDYFNNTCIILLHATIDPMETKGTKNTVLLRNLQLYLSRERQTRTAIMDLGTFTTKVGRSYFNIKRPLFVILNDQGNVQHLLTNQVSTWITMAYPTWMIFLSEGSTASDFFSRMDIPFDCEFLVSESNGTMEVITEVYRVSPGDVLRNLPFGTWSPTDGVRTTRLTFYQRRSNLFGKKLRVTSIENPPMSTILTDEQGEMIGVGGLFGRILEILQEKMNCTFEYIECDSWGSISPNGTWNGMLALLNERKADLAASELVMTSSRTQIVDFTIPIVSSRFRTYIQRPSFAFVKWRGYTAPFSKNIWMTAVSLIILSSIIIVWMEYAESCLKRHRNFINSRLMETILAVFGAFCGQGIMPSPLTTARTIHLAIHLTAVILLAAYSGALVSFLAVQMFTMPFTTMEGLLKDGTYKFGVVSSSAEYNFFSNTSDLVLRALFEERMESDRQLPRNYLEGLRRVCEENKYGFMITDTMVEALENRVDCIIEALETMLQTSLAMAVTKNSPYRGIVNANILMMRDSGILKRIFKAEWPVKFTKAKQQWSSVEFGDIVPLILVLVCGIILGSIFVCAERFITWQTAHFRFGNGIHRTEVKNVN
ncbi:probable glutamate receptor isoform X1 [Neodiprion lecontei]|uniref:Probable glutamate receptor isoform X1 n=1 Tax=Neodiprion lecontei TaxID=441921 RepID=A0A6J0BA24_NEOLC|nr:probable glutamate receptor isoform X1 [Neodiprion lecontei]XP_046598285.1 probable glutamate receptor isoform X1 [Neodiprion lecontei]